MRQHNYFLVLKNRDTTEGRGPMLPTDIAFTHRQDAIEFVKGQVYARKFGVQCTPGNDHCVEETTMFVYESLEEYMANASEMEKERKRRRALSKLTPEERKLLDLE